MVKVGEHPDCHSQVLSHGQESTNRAANTHHTKNVEFPVCRWAKSDPQTTKILASLKHLNLFDKERCWEQGWKWACSPWHSHASQQSLQQELRTFSEPTQPNSILTARWLDSSCSTGSWLTLVATGQMRYYTYISARGHASGWQEEGEITGGEGWGGAESLNCRWWAS